MASKSSVDFLIVGAGAMGMAFVDTLLSDTKASIFIVDRYARPGGHWTIAYPFVRLHQPSAFYGVNSKELGDGVIDQVGWNKGLAELATGDEVCAYFSKVMYQTFLPSGRVKYFPKHEYLGQGWSRSIITKELFQVEENTRIVDATYMKVTVPAMGPPSYQVAENVSLVTPNQLPNMTRPYGSYTVVGAGKTGIDACLWLLAHGVDPNLISWIMPRDSWYMERGRLQPKRASTVDPEAATKAFAPIMEATSPQDLFLRQESAVSLTRLDQNVWPTMFRCATISFAELEQIRKIGTIIRQGRVVGIEADKVTMEKGTYKPSPDTLYVDCTADGLARLDPVPVFSGRTITLQAVRYCQQVFSAAFIAHIEATYDDEGLKNKLCGVVPHPDDAKDYLTVSLQTFQNELEWAARPKTRAWLSSARLNWIGNLLAPPPKDPERSDEHYAAVRAGIQGLCSKLEQLIGEDVENNGVKAEP